MAAERGHSLFYPFLAAAARIRHVATLRTTLAAARAGEYVAEDGSVRRIPSAALEDAESVSGATLPTIRASTSQIPRVRVRSLDAVALVSERTIHAEGSKPPALVLGCTPAAPGGKTKIGPSPPPRHAPNAAHPRPSGSFKPESELCRRSNLMVGLQGLAFPLPRPSAHFLPRVTAFRDSAAQHYRFLDQPLCFAAVVVPAPRKLRLALRSPVSAEDVHTVEELLATAPPGCPAALAPSSARYVARVVCAALALAQRRGHRRVVLHAASLASKVDGRLWLPGPEDEWPAAVAGRGPESPSSSANPKSKPASPVAAAPGDDHPTNPAAGATPALGPPPAVLAEPFTSSTHPDVWVGHLPARAAHAVVHAAIARITAWLATRAFAHAFSEVSVCLDPAFVPGAASLAPPSGPDAALAAALTRDAAKSLFQRLREVGEAAHAAQGSMEGGCALPPDIRRVLDQFAAGLSRPASVATAAADDAFGAAHALLFAHHGPGAEGYADGGAEGGSLEPGAADPVAGAGAGDTPWKGPSLADGGGSEERSDDSDASDAEEEDDGGSGTNEPDSGHGGARVLPFCAGGLRCGVSVGQMSPEWIDDAGHLVSRPAGQVPGAVAAVVGPFELLCRLGAGVEGEVHSARHLETNELFALKAVWLDRCPLGSNRRRHLLMQLNALRALPPHQGLVGVSYVDEEVMFPRRPAPGSGGPLWSPAALLVMPLVTGGEILPVLRAGGGLAPDLARLCARQLCEAVDACHRAGVIHRDLKPDNLLFSLDGRLQVADFGFATVVGAGNEDSHALKTPCGTRAYMAPEVRGGGSYHGARSDAWSVGVVAFIFLAGVPPVGEPTRRDWYFRKLLSGRLDLFWTAHERHTAFSPVARDFFQRALAVNPASRLTVPDMLHHPYLASVPPLRTPARRTAERAVAEEVAARLRQMQRVDPLTEAAQEIERRSRCPPSAPALARASYEPELRELATSPPLSAVAHPSEVDLYKVDVVRGVGAAEETAADDSWTPGSTTVGDAPPPPRLPAVDTPALATLPTERDRSVVGVADSGEGAGPGLCSAAEHEVRTVEVCSILEAKPTELWDSLWRCAHAVARRGGRVLPVDASGSGVAAALARLAFRPDQVPLAAAWSVRVEGVGAAPGRCGPRTGGEEDPAPDVADSEGRDEEQLPPALPSLRALESSSVGQETLLVAGVPMGSRTAVIRAMSVS